MAQPYLSFLVNLASLVVRSVHYNQSITMNRFITFRIHVR